MHHVRKLVRVHVDVKGVKSTRENIDRNLERQGPGAGFQKRLEPGDLWIM